MRRIFFIPILIPSLILILGCSRQTSAGGSSLDQEAARRFSDTLADDLIGDRRDEIINKLDGDLKKTMDARGLRGALDAMISLFGQPTECKYKADELGYKISSSGRRAMRKFWYSAKTTKHPEGYYLFVEVVQEGAELRTTGFSIVTFPGGAPPNLR